MRNILILFLTAVTAVAQGDAVDRYVSTNGTHDVAGGFTSWVGAATNIQAAIDKAAVGDTVWVTNGVYHLSTHLSISKGITLRSWSDSQNDTLLVGGYPAVTNRILYLNHVDAVVKGFTLTNGAAPDESSSAGGGAKIEAGTLRACTVLSCYSIQTSAWNRGWGGGVYAKGVNSLITDCRVEGNTTMHSGGGVALESGAQLRNSQLLGNTTLSASSSQQGGGGVFIGPGCLAEDCVIVSNKAMKARGGGASLLSGGARMVNCLLLYNSALTGGGFSATSLNTEIFNDVVNCTVASNSPNGVHTTYNAGKALWCENSIIYGNSPVNISLDMYNGGAEIYFHYTCLPGVLSLSGVRVTLGDGNLDANPLFVDLAGGNVHLQSNSPCKNAGTNQLWMVGAKDLDGKPRLDSMTGKVDMGCYEHVSTGTLLTIR